MQEIFKEIVGYNGDYSISNLGRVKSFRCNKNKINGKILKPCDNGDGYFKIDLRDKNGKQRPKQIHILMYETFNNYKLKKNECIHHIDFTKNNYLDNFEVMTKSEHNRLHMLGENHPMYGKHHSEKSKQLMSKKNKGENHPRGMLNKNHSEKSKQLISETKKEKFKNGELNQKGEKSPNHTLTEQKVIKIKIDLDEGILTQKEIGEKFGVNQGAISKIKNRRTWKL